ncbi:MAG: hypothetical protein GEU99_16365 [Luteitalea sp.]|nr:hypothetical protein [Luteitalea sp.]
MLNHTQIDQLVQGEMQDSQAGLPAALQELHRATLREFLDSGAAPTVTWLRQAGQDLELDPTEAITRLADVDLVHVGSDSVMVAYPFSGRRTAHRVRLSDTPPLYAMCAVDALGIPAMTGRDGVIASSEGGEVIRVERREGAWLWEPASTVLLHGRTEQDGPASVCACPNIRFFASAQQARTYLEANPHVRGPILDQDSAVEVARRIFGSLLGATATR